MREIPRDDGSGMLRIQDHQGIVGLSSHGGGMPVGIRFSHGEARATARAMLEITDPMSPEAREGLRHALGHLDLADLGVDDGIVDYD